MSQTSKPRRRVPERAQIYWLAADLSFTIFVRVPKPLDLGPQVPRFEKAILHAVNFILDDFIRSLPDRPDDR